LAASHRYLIALGSNVRHVSHGAPRKVIGAAIVALDGSGVRVEAVSPVIASAPLGPSRRRYANAVAIVRSGMAPVAMLECMQAIERAFGRRRRGARWSARVLDLDLILWSGGAWTSARLTVPHREFSDRDFVLGPAAAVAPHWRDPATGLTLRQLRHRLKHRKPRRA